MGARRVAFAVLTGGILIAGCTVEPASRSGPFPAACGAMGFSSVQCQAIVERAEKMAGVDAARVGSVNFLRFDNAQHVSLGGIQVARVELRLDSGQSQIEDVWCVGVGHESDRACNADAKITIGGGVDHDVPCSGEPPAGCATLPTSPDPSAIAAALPLHLASFSISLDHDGHYEVAVGAATLPDGALSERRAALVDPSPTSYWIENGIRIEVRSDVPGRPPIGSVYRDPFDGVEPVHVFLVFDAVDVQTGAVLELRDLVVR